MFISCHSEVQKREYNFTRNSLLNESSNIGRRHLAIPRKIYTHSYIRTEKWLIKWGCPRLKCGYSLTFMLVTAEFCINQKGRESKHHGALLVHFWLIDFSKKIFEILIHPYGMPRGYVDSCKTLEVEIKIFGAVVARFQDCWD